MPSSGEFVFQQDSAVQRTEHAISFLTLRYRKMVHSEAFEVWTIFDGRPLYYKFTTKCASARILKIGQYLILAKTYGKLIVYILIILVSRQNWDRPRKRATALYKWTRISKKVIKILQVRECSYTNRVAWVG